MPKKTVNMTSSLDHYMIWDKSYTSDELENMYMTLKLGSKLQGSCIFLAMLGSGHPTGNKHA
jgi:hypothetical protein